MSNRDGGLNLIPVWFRLVLVGGRNARKNCSHGGDRIASLESAPHTQDCKEKVLEGRQPLLGRGHVGVSCLDGAVGVHLGRHRLARLQYHEFVTLFMCGGRGSLVSPLDLGPVNTNGACRRQGRNR